MYQLQLVWLATFVLAGASMLILFLLVVRRAWDEYQDKRYNHVRSIIQQILFRYMLNAEDADQNDLVNLLGFKQRDKPVLRKLAIDLFHLVQGKERVRLAAILQEIGFREQCLQDLRRGNARQRQLAAAALQIFNDKGCRDALIHALDDTSEHTRIAAADSLLVIDALPPLDVLIAKLRTQVDVQSRDVRTLFRDIARHSPQHLMKLAKQQDIGLVEKLLIAEAMAESRDYQVLDVLLIYATDDNVELKTTALRSLATLQHPAAAEVVSKSLPDMAWQVRAVAAKAAGRIGLQECVSALNFLLDDKNWWVRFRAAEALFKLGGDGIAVLEVRATYAGCGGFGRGARMAALILDENGLRDFVDDQEVVNA